MPNRARAGSCRRAATPYLLAALAALGLGEASAAKPSPNETKILSRTGQADRELENSGARLVADRGGYKVYAAPSNSPAARGAVAGAVVREDFDRIMLRRGALDARLPEPSRAPGFEEFSAERRLKLVQFSAPPTDAELEKLRATGAEIVHYVPQNAYIVWTATPSIAAEAAKLEARGLLQSFGDYRAEHAVSPQLDSLLASAEPVDVTVQFHNFGKLADGRMVGDDVNEALVMAEGVIQMPYEVLGGRYINAKLRVSGDEVLKIAAIPSVVNVEPYFEKSLLGERQGQILAREWDFSDTAPSGPGYLAWLADHGFSTDPADYPVVVVVDDGVDNGTNNPANAEFRELNNALSPSRLVFGVLPPGSFASGPEGPDGHGNINASIVAGYNASTGAAFEDSDGFNYGLGISPYGRVANCRIFAPGFDVGDGFTPMEEANYAMGARISTNSWGAGGFSPLGVYTADSQEYDGIARDALPSTAGNQGMVIIFAAGNAGPGSGTVGDPGTAKNVITVGAGENSDPASASGDGCSETAADGDSLQDMADFSSRGPCDDGRVKPDIMAPGTFVHGAASQPVFGGTGVCGAATNDFSEPGDDALFPPGSAYTWSSGTSHSTPGIAGVASLTAEYLARAYGFDPLEAATADSPSPALIKAYMLHATSHITGDGANEDLPGNSQGYGIADNDFAFDMAPAPRIFVNQTHVFDNPGEARGYFGQIADPSKPFRVALAWSDAPGSTSGDAYVNDLNLTVGGPGGEYFGNNFSGGESVPGGAPDTRNNVECVFLPAGSSGSVSILIDAASIGGDGVPGFGDATDQDFALVIYNFIETPTPFFEKDGAQTFVDSGGNGNNDGLIDPGENQIDITLGLRNSGTGDATGIIATLSSLSPTVSVATAAAAYPDLTIGASASNAMPFTIAVSPDHACGAPIMLELAVSSAEGSNSTRFSLPTGAPPTVSTQTDSPGAPINDNSSTVTTLTFPDAGLIVDLDARLDISHTFTGDIDIDLRSPAGTTVTLFNRRGSGASNLSNVTFDDEAAQPIASASPPYSGPYQPEQSLSAFDGEDFNGVWTLTVTDNAGGDTGTVNTFAIDATTSAGACSIPGASLRLGSVALDDNLPGNNVNGFVDPGEDIALTLTVDNEGSTDATNTSATLTTKHPLATVTAGASLFDIPGGGSQANGSTLTVNFSGALSCGDVVPMTLTISSDQGMFFMPFSVTVGEPGGGVFNASATDLPQPINDNATTTSVISIIAPGGATINDVNLLGLNITHTFDGDLDITLESPSGTIVELTSDNGGSGADYIDTDFDDEAAGSIEAGAPPFTGSFQPETPLSAFDGEPAAGDWTLRVFDDAGGDVGTLNGWSLQIDAQSFSCVTVPVELSAFGIE